ncbi:hypothetical protein HYV83_01450 [Candidatus Woesearchaeota archaeon]|nr:hypothetical protein [Candidatus Woesearchaeota archaeon]
MAGDRIKPFGANGQPKVGIDLEELMKQPSIHSVMQELIRQMGGTSREKLIDILAIHDPSGKLSEVNYASLHDWFSGGKIPYRSAIQIEAAVEAITGSHEPFLSRFYKQSKV